MALLFQESFDGYNSIQELWRLKKVEANHRTGVYNAAGGKYGGGSFQPGDLSEGLRFPLLQAVSGNMIRAAFWFKSNQAGSTSQDRPLIGFRNEDDTRAWRAFNIGTAGATTLQVSRFDDVTTATLLTAGATVIGNNAWHHIEIALKADPTTGELRAWIDGTVDANINITSGDTSDAASGDVTAFTRVTIGGACSNTVGADDIHVDDLIVWDDSGSGFTGRLNDQHRIRRSPPPAAGSTSGWTPSSGQNFQCVDEAAPNDDTDHVETSVTGTIDYYAMNALSYQPGTVYAAIIENVVRRTGLKHMNWRAKMKKGATVENGVTKAVPPGFNKLEGVFERDPNGVDWTSGSILTAEIGQEYVS